MLDSCSISLPFSISTLDRKQKYFSCTLCYNYFKRREKKITCIINLCCTLFSSTLEQRRGNWRIMFLPTVLQNATCHNISSICTFCCSAQNNMQSGTVFNSIILREIYSCIQTDPISLLASFAVTYFTFSCDISAHLLTSLEKNEWGDKQQKGESSICLGYFSLSQQ